MKRLLFPLLCLLTLLGWSCSSDKSNDDRPVIATSTPALAWMTEQIAGDDFRVISLLPAGADAESYEPDMQTMKSLSDADILFYINFPGFENNLVDKIRKGASDDVEIVDASVAIPRLRNEHSGGEDPHILTSPGNARVVADNILNALIGRYPDKKEEFMSRAEQLTAKISTSGEDARKIIGQLKEHNGNEIVFVSIHPSMSYYADFYGLKQITLEQEGKEPSPRQLEEQLNKAAAMNPKILIYERSHNPEQAEVYAKRLGIKAVPIDFNSPDFINYYTSIAKELGVRQ